MFKKIKELFRPMDFYYEADRNKMLWTDSDLVCILVLGIMVGFVFGLLV
jgi:hypothetical protein